MQECVSKTPCHKGGSGSVHPPLLLTMKSNSCCALNVQILAKVYLARSDVGFSVRSAAVHVWKTLVTNTPRTLSEILPCLMENIIELLASEGKSSICTH